MDFTDDNMLKALPMAESKGFVEDNIIIPAVVLLAGVTDISVAYHRGYRRQYSRGAMYLVNTTDGSFAPVRTVKNRTALHVRQRYLSGAHRGHKTKNHLNSPRCK